MSISRPVSPEPHPALHRAIHAVLLGAALLGLPEDTRAASAKAPVPLSAYVDTAGSPSFEDRFAAFDHGTDQSLTDKPHRWRTVYGYGGALSMSNRHMSSTSFASDAGFSGLRAARPGPRPLGLDPFVHRPGLLTIQARRTPDDLRLLTWNKPFYGGVITTKFSFAQRYGYFEIEARLPAGKGMWPAFWLMPVDGNWPDAGEIDVMENLGDPRSVYCTVIAGAGKVSRKIALDFDASSGFHRYGALWRPDVIIWFVDGREVSRAPTPPALTQRKAYLIANLAVGGSWGGFPDKTTPFPGRYDIRRISVWPLPPRR